MRMVLGIGLLGSLALGAGMAPQRGEGTPILPTEARWELLWDDTVDDTLDGASKRAVVALSTIQDTVAGTFIGPVAGTHREAILTGVVVASEHTPLLLMQQREPGYTCAYQLRVLPGGTLRGVWHDTRSRRGDVVLRPLGCPRSGLSSGNPTVRERSF